MALMLLSAGKWNNPLDRGQRYTRRDVPVPTSSTRGHNMEWVDGVPIGETSFDHLTSLLYRYVKLPPSIRHFVLLYRPPGVSIWIGSAAAVSEWVLWLVVYLFGFRLTMHHNLLQLNNIMAALIYILPYRGKPTKKGNSSCANVMDERPNEWARGHICEAVVDELGQICFYEFKLGNWSQAFKLSFSIYYKKYVISGQ